MSKLLRADFARLKRDKYFWTGILGMAAYGIFVSLLQYRNSMKYGTVVKLENIFYQEYMAIGVILAAFCSMFLGTEYSDGTIRNKLVVGCGRAQIYLSGFLTCAAAGLLMNISYMAACVAAGIPLFGLFGISAGTAARLVLAGGVMTVSFAAIFTLLAMLNQNKTLVAIISIIGTFGAMFLAIFLLTRIGQPQLIEGAVLTTGEEQTVQYVPNPLYLDEDARENYQFFADVLPTGQSIQISGARVAHIWRIMLYSLTVTAVTTSAGVFFFRRKDLK